MTSTLVGRTAIAAIWSLVAWNSWECIELYAGAAFLGDSVQNAGFYRFYPARDYAMIVTQVPLVLGLRLGVDDLRWLARLQTFGTFLLPAALYILALVRTKGDAVLQATVIVTVALVFMTTWYFTIGEYNTAYAIVVAAAAVVLTADRPRLADGILLVILAVLALRTYEVFLYLGPLLAGVIFWAVRQPPSPATTTTAPPLARHALLLGAMTAVAAGLAFLGAATAPVCVGASAVAATLWAAWRPADRPAIANLLYLTGAALFLAGSAVAAESIVNFVVPVRLHDTAHGVLRFGRNIQFVVALGAVLVVTVWALIKPQALEGSRPYRWAGLWLVVLALLPLLGLVFPAVRPRIGEDYFTRTICGLVIAAIVAFMWIAKSGHRSRPAALQVLEAPGAARRVLLFAVALLLAALPSEIYVTARWTTYLEAMRTAAQADRRVMAFDDTPLARFPNFILGDDLTYLADQLFLLRSKPDSRVIVVRHRKDVATIRLPRPRPYNLGGRVWGRGAGSIAVQSRTSAPPTAAKAKP